MSQKIFFLTLCMGILILLGACDDRKYEEGPFLSIWPAKDRIEGKWQWAIARETQSGEVVNWSLRFEGDTLEFKADGTVTDSRYGVEGSWTLISKKNEINILLGDKSDSLRVAPAIAFDIRLLKRNEMWLEFLDDSTRIEWQLKSLDVN